MLQALEAVNTQLRELYPDSEELFDIVLMTNNHAQVGVRLINSINHYGELSTKHLRAGAASFWGGVVAGQRVKEMLAPVSFTKPRAEPAPPNLTGL